MKKLFKLFCQRGRGEHQRGRGEHCEPNYLKMKVLFFLFCILFLCSCNNEKIDKNLKQKNETEIHTTENNIEDESKEKKEYVDNNILDKYDDEEEIIKNDNVYYDREGNIFEKGLFFDDGKIIFIKDGKRIYDYEEKNIEGKTFNYDVLVVNGKVEYNLKNKTIEYKKNGGIYLNDEGNRAIGTIEDMYFKLDYSKEYGFSEGKLYLTDYDGNILESYKNEFHTFSLQDTLEKNKNRKIEEIKNGYVDNINMPEDGISKKVRFDFKKEMNIRPLSETYYFYEDSNIAYNGVNTIDGKKYLFNERGCLVKNGCYVDTKGNAYIADENGIVIEKEGFFTIVPYDEDGNLDIDVSFVYLTEISDRSYRRRYYVNKNGKVECNNLFVVDGDIYYADENCELLNNSYLTTRYYFGNDCKLKSGEINKENIYEIKNLIDSLLTRYSIKDLQGIVVDIDKYDELKNRVNSIVEDENNVVEKDYLSIIKKEDKLYVDNKLVTDVFIYPNDYKGMFAGKDYNIRKRYYDSLGDMVTNDIIKIDEDMYLIDKNGYALVSYKLTEGIIKKYFENETVNKLMKYENYFTDDEGRILFSYEDICEKLVKEYKNKLDEENNQNKIDYSVYEKSVESIVLKLDDKNNYNKHGEFETKEDMPVVFKAELRDIDKDSICELLLLRKEDILGKCFLTLDLYKYEKEQFNIVDSKRLLGIFYRDFELTKVGFKMNEFSEYRMFVESRKSGSSVEVQYYDFDDMKINYKYAVRHAGSDIGSWQEDLNERINEMGLDYYENEFYDYRDSYLENDKNVNVILSFEKVTEKSKNEKGYYDYGEKFFLTH